MTAQQQRLPAFLTRCLQDYGGPLSLSSYMTLPVEQYFVLDPKQIRWIEANRFHLVVPRIEVRPMPRIASRLHGGHDDLSNAEGCLHLLLLCNLAHIESESVTLPAFIQPGPLLIPPSVLS